MAAEQAGSGPGYSEVFPRTVHAVGDARRLVREALRAWALVDEDEDVCVVVSELVTNAVRHTTAEALRLTVDRTSPGRVRVTVADGSGAMPVLRVAGPGAVDGRGLALVAALSGGVWGVEPAQAGKRVWAEVALSDGSGA